jgi:molybdenum cofactor biosynthesis enzyme MoaA
MKIETFSILAGTAACNANCPYCISKMTGIKKFGFKENPINWRNFSKACRLAQVNNVSTVLITGKGESTLYPHQITEFLKNLSKFDFPLIELQTNALLFDKKDYDNYLREWFSLGLNTIAISIAHYKKSENRKIFTKAKDYINLEKVIKKLHTLGFSVRLSCVMMKGFIDKVDEIRNLAEFAKKNQVEQLTIRKLGIISESENPEISKWCRDRALLQKELDEIKNFLDRNAKTLMTLPHGAIIYEFEGTSLCLTDCVMLHPKTDEIRTLIFFPDGHLRYNWDLGGAILL